MKRKITEINFNSSVSKKDTPILSNNGNDDESMLNEEINELNNLIDINKNKLSELNTNLSKNFSEFY